MLFFGKKWHKKEHLQQTVIYMLFSREKTVLRHIFQRNHFCIKSRTTFVNIIIKY